MKAVRLLRSELVKIRARLRTCEEDQEEFPAGLTAVQAMQFELGDNQKNVFDTSDIMEDLKGLSMDVAEQCGLRPWCLCNIW